MRFLWYFFKYLVALVLVLLLGVGAYAGNTAYQQLFNRPWDKLLAIENHRNDLDTIHMLEQKYGWQRVSVHSGDGTRLQGTYIENPSGSHDTVIILHGLYQNRTMDVPYARVYLARGYNVLMLSGELDVPMVSMLEEKLEKTRFARVDADIIDRLIVKDDVKKEELQGEERENLTQVFRSQLPKLDKIEINVDVQALGPTAQPTVITQSEYMRRMKDMSRFQPGMSFYGQMPDSYTLVLNSDHDLVKKVLADTDAATADALKPIVNELKGQQARLAALHQSQSKKKPEEITKEEKDDLQQTEKAVNEQRDKRSQVLSDYAKGNKVVHQLIDLALLQNGMLKGAALNAFVKRSVELIDK